MSSIDFENGLLVGLAIAYKKAARAIGIAEFLFVSIADGVHQSALALPVAESISATLPVDIRPPAVDSTSLPLMTITDAVQAIRTP